MLLSKRHHPDPSLLLSGDELQNIHLYDYCWYDKLLLFLYFKSIWIKVSVMLFLLMFYVCCAG